jgi:hypothetical protein
VDRTNRIRHALEGEWSTKNSNFVQTFVQTFVQMVWSSLSKCLMVGLVRIELTTSSLSVTRSNRLSYSPVGVLIYTSEITVLDNGVVPELRSD